MIEIRKSETADTRTCDWSNVSKQDLLNSSRQHIDDVRAGMEFLIKIMEHSALVHDVTKIIHIDEFHEDFITGFESTKWWGMHQREERHHFNNPEYIQEDVTLIDVLEQITDGVMAGIARSGEYRFEPLSNELLQKAYKNTADMLIRNTKVI